MPSIPQQSYMLMEKDYIRRDPVIYVDNFDIGFIVHVFDTMRLHSSVRPVPNRLETIYIIRQQHHQIETTA